MVTGRSYLASHGPWWLLYKLIVNDEFSKGDVILVFYFEYFDWLPFEMLNFTFTSNTLVTFWILQRLIG